MNRTDPNTDVALSCEGANPEAQALILLSVQAVLRGHHSFMTGLGAFQHMDEPSAKSESSARASVPDIDATLTQPREVCPEDEAEGLGRLLAIKLRDGDQVRLDAPLALMGRRCAN